MRGDEPCLCVVQHEPRRGDEPVQVRRERERRKAEQELEVVSAGEADDVTAASAAMARDGKAVAGDCGVMTELPLAAVRDNESALKSGLLLYDHA